jgi:hypothetical protein
MRVTVDGLHRPETTVALVDDRREHAVEVRIPALGPDAQNQQPDSKTEITAQATK